MLENPNNRHRYSNTDVTIRTPLAWWPGNSRGKPPLARQTHDVHTVLSKLSSAENTEIETDVGAGGRYPDAVHERKVNGAIGKFFGAVSKVPVVRPERTLLAERFSPNCLFSAKTEMASVLRFHLMSAGSPAGRRLT